MSFKKVYKENWVEILSNQSYPTKGSLYIGYDNSGNLGYGSDVLLQMDEWGNVFPIGSGSTMPAVYGGIYINDKEVPVTIGGVEAGTSFPDPGNTLQEMWDLLLYPYQYPAFTFSLGTTPLEIGVSFDQGTFEWSTSNSDNVVDNSVEISGYLFTTETGLSSSGTFIATFNGNVTRDSSDGPGVQTWSIKGENTEGGIIGPTTYSIRWDWKWYWGTSTDTSLTGIQITQLSSGELYSSYSRTYQYLGGGYKYLCFANDYSGPNRFRDEDYFFGIAMYDWDGVSSASSENGIYYDLVSVTNNVSPTPQTTEYRVYRTQNIMGDAFGIIVD